MLSFIKLKYFLYLSSFLYVIILISLQDLREITLFSNISQYTLEKDTITDLPRFLFGRSYPGDGKKIPLSEQYHENSGELLCRFARRLFFFVVVRFLIFFFQAILRLLFLF